MKNAEQAQKTYNKNNVFLNDNLDTKPKIKKAVKKGLISGREGYLRSEIIDHEGTEHGEQRKKELENYKAGEAGAKATPVVCPDCKVATELLLETEENLEDGDKQTEDIFLEEDVEGVANDKSDALLELEEDKKDPIDKNKKGEMKEFAEYSALVSKLTNMSKGEFLHIAQKLANNGRIDPRELSSNDKAFLLKNKSSIDRYVDKNGKDKFATLIKEIEDHIAHGHNPIGDTRDRLAKKPEKLSGWQKRQRALGTAALKNRLGDGRGMVDFDSRTGQLVEGRNNYNREMFHSIRSIGRMATSLVFGKNWADSTLKEHYQAVANKVNKHNEFSCPGIGALDYGTIFGVGDDNEPMTLDEMTDADNLRNKYLGQPKTKREKIKDRMSETKGAKIIKGAKEKIAGIFEYSPDEPEPRVLKHLDTHEVLDILNLTHDPGLVARLSLAFDPKNFSRQEDDSEFTFGDINSNDVITREKMFGQSFNYSQTVKGYKKADVKLEQILMKAPDFNRFDPDGKIWEDFVTKAGGQDGDARQMIRMVQENLRAAPQIIEERATEAREKWKSTTELLRKQFTESDFETGNGRKANFTYLLVEFQDKKMIQARVNIGDKESVEHDANDHENGYIIGYIDYKTGLLYAPQQSQSTRSERQDEPNEDREEVLLEVA